MVVKKRDPVFVIVVSILTLFIYGLYWFYHTRKELNELTGKKSDPLLHTIGLLIPIVDLYVLWKYSEDVEIASKKSRDKVILFLAWIVFFPVAQYLTQEELNKFAK